HIHTCAPCSGQRGFPRDPLGLGAAGGVPAFGAGLLALRADAATVAAHLAAQGAHVHYASSPIAASLRKTRRACSIAAGLKSESNPARFHSYRSIPQWSRQRCTLSSRSTYASTAPMPNSSARKR